MPTIVISKIRRQLTGASANGISRVNAFIGIRNYKNTITEIWNVYQTDSLIDIKRTSGFVATFKSHQIRI